MRSPNGGARRCGALHLRFLRNSQAPTSAHPGRVLAFTPIAGSTAKASAKGGDNEAIDFSSMARVEPGDGNGLGATLRAQRHGRDHGPLASQLGRCGGQQEDLRRDGWHAHQGRRVRHRAVPRRGRDAESARCEIATVRGHRRLGGQSCRLHRAERPGLRRQVEGRGRAGATGQQQQDGSGLCHYAGRPEDRNSGGQAAERSDPARARPLLPAGSRDPREPGLVREDVRRQA